MTKTNTAEEQATGAKLRHVDGAALQEKILAALQQVEQERKELQSRLVETQARLGEVDRRIAYYSGQLDLLNQMAQPPEAEPGA